MSWSFLFNFIFFWISLSFFFFSFIIIKILYFSYAYFKYISFLLSGVYATFSSAFGSILLLIYSSCFYFSSLIFSSSIAYIKSFYNLGNIYFALILSVCVISFPSKECNESTYAITKSLYCGQLKYIF